MWHKNVFQYRSIGLLNDMMHLGIDYRTQVLAYTFRYFSHSFHL